MDVAKRFYQYRDHFEVKRDIHVWRRHRTLSLILRKLCANKHYRFELSKIFPAILAQSIRAKIQEVNSTLFNQSYQIQAQKLKHLKGFSNYLWVITWIP